MAKKYNDNRVQSSYDSMLLYKLTSEEKYHLLIPLETVPSVFGDTETFDYDLLTMATKGQVQGKVSLDSKDVQFLFHRDNVMRLEELQDKTLDFLAVYRDFTARKFSGTITVRPDDASAGIQYGTFTITPISADKNTILDARPLIMETVSFTTAIPASLTIGTAAERVGVATDPSDATITATCTNSAFTCTYSDGNVSISKASSAAAAPQYGIVKIAASKVGYASWTTTIAVNY